MSEASRDPADLEETLEENLDRLRFAPLGSAFTHTYPLQNALLIRSCRDSLKRPLRAGTTPAFPL